MKDGIIVFLILVGTLGCPLLSHFNPRGLELVFCLALVLVVLVRWFNYLFVILIVVEVFARWMIIIN
jgi:hypothetical protein